MAGQGSGRKRSLRLRVLAAGVLLACGLMVGGFIFVRTVIAAI